jgi:hypothetical protein
LRDRPIVSNLSSIRSNSEISNTLSDTPVVQETSRTRVRQSINDFRVDLLNKKIVQYGLNHNDICFITINKQSEITNYLMNWLKDASAIEIIKRPLINISEEE